MPRSVNDGFQNFHSQFREVPGIREFFLPQAYFSVGFSGVARQTGLNEFVEFNSSPTRGNSFCTGL